MSLLPAQIDLSRNEDLRVAFEFLDNANAPVAIPAGTFALALRWRGITKNVPLTPRVGPTNILDGVLLLASLSDMPIGASFLGDLVLSNAGATSVWASVSVTRQEIVQETDDLGGRTVRVTRQAGATIAVTVATTGAPGANGWSPVFSIEADGARRVQRVVDWTGGQGPKPATGLYVGASGLVSLIADAVDIRGPLPAPGGSSGAMQFNNAGGFDGAPGLTFDPATRALTLSGGPVIVAGDQSAPGWTTNGIRFRGVPATLTDTTSSGAVPAAYTNVFGGNTIAAANAVTFTDYFTTFINPPNPGANVTIPNRWALGLGGDLRVNGRVRIGDGFLIDQGVGQITLGGSVNSPNFYAASAFSQAVGSLGFALGPFGGPDTFIGRRAAANFRLGALDAAAPVAQTISVQGVAAGNANTAGAQFTIDGAQGTGSAPGGAIAFRVAPAGSSGSGQNPLSTALQINSNGSVSFPLANVFFETPTGAGNIGPVVIRLAGGSDGYVVTRGDGRNIALSLGALNMRLSAAGALAWFNGADHYTATLDTFMVRDAAGTVAMRNAANAQAFRVYNTGDPTNGEFAGIRWSANVLEFGAQAVGTGVARMLRFASAASGVPWEFRHSTNPLPQLVLAGSDRSVTLFPQINMLAIASGGVLSTLDYAPGASAQHALRSQNANAATTYFGLAGSAAGVMQLNNGGGRGDGFGAAIEFFEMVSAPPAPPTNGMRVYTIDNGAGKTQYFALFATGAPVLLAQQP